MLKHVFALVFAGLAVASSEAVANAARFDGTWTVPVTNDNGTTFNQVLIFQQLSPTTTRVRSGKLAETTAIINGDTATGIIGPVRFEMTLSGPKTAHYIVYFDYPEGSSTRHGPVRKKGTGIATRN